MSHGELLVGERIAQWAAQTPDAPAIEHAGAVLTYAQLLDQSRRVGRGMHDCGVRPGSIVALDIERSLDAVLAMLGAWSIGAAFMPMDPQWPAARRRAVVVDASACLWVHSTPRGGELQNEDAPFVSMARLNDPSRDATPYVHLAPSRHDLAYVLYTSGSTGSPKGVMIEHAQVLNYVAGASEVLGLGKCRRWGLLGTIAADLGYTALFGALFNGSCLVIGEAAEVQDAESFARFVRERAIDGLKIVPSHLEALLESERPSVPRKLILGGEATSPALLERIFQIAPDCEVHNHYGPTETTVGVMVHKVDAIKDRGAVTPLTKTLPNNAVYVLDKHMSAVSEGELGDVYIGGAQVCRGYLHARHDEAFVLNPLHPGGRLYRTGDLAYSLPGGGIRLAGRADDQVKIQGYRVEPAEVEAALLVQTGVRQAAVVVKNKRAAPELAAFVVASEAEGARRKLQEAMANTLPSYMVPRSYVFVDELPRLSNGKIDRRSLASLPTAAEARTASEVEDPVLFVIAQGMAELLKRDSIDAEEDFFELGGHSLLVIKLVARIRKHLGVEISPATVFDHSTPKALTAITRGASSDTNQLEARANARRRSLEQPQAEHTA